MNSSSSRSGVGRVALDFEVDRIVTEAEQLHTLPPKMERFINTYPLFIRWVARFIRTIAPRSQDFRDGQVTVWDKALLIVTRHGNDIAGSIPFQFFCQHWCEYDPTVGSPTQMMYDMNEFNVLPWDGK